MGEILFDRYEVIEQIGEGASSKVYKVNDLDLEDIVALKVINATDRNARKRLVGEAKKLHNLTRKRKSKHIVPLFECGTVGDQVYSSSKLMDRTLADLPAPCPKKAKGLVKQILKGLSEIHKQGIVHGDIRLENIFVEGKGRNINLMIGDFGILDHEPGNIQYCAPELFDCVEKNLSVDIFALGCISYYLQTGELPFSEIITDKAYYEENKEEIRKRVEERIKQGIQYSQYFKLFSAGSKSKYLKTFTLNCLKDKNQRYSNAMSALFGLRKPVLIETFGSIAVLAAIFGLLYFHYQPGPRFIVSHRHKNGSEIRMIRPSGKQEQRVTFEKGLESNIQVVDGVLSYVRDKDVYVMFPMFGEERKLIEDLVSPKLVCFSPDGKRVAFVKKDLEPLVYNYGAKLRSKNNNTLFIADVVRDGFFEQIVKQNYGFYLRNIRRIIKSINPKSTLAWDKHSKEIYFTLKMDYPGATPEDGGICSLNPDRLLQSKVENEIRRWSDHEQDMYPLPIDQGLVFVRNIRKRQRIGYIYRHIKGLAYAGYNEHFHNPFFTRAFVEGKDGTIYFCSRERDTLDVHCINPRNANMFTKKLNIGVAETPTAEETMITFDGENLYAIALFHEDINNDGVVDDNDYAICDLRTRGGRIVGLRSKISWGVGILEFTHSRQDLYSLMPFNDYIQQIKHKVGKLKDYIVEKFSGKD